MIYDIGIRLSTTAGYIIYLLVWLPRACPEIVLVPGNQSTFRGSRCLYVWPAVVSNNGFLRCIPFSETCLYLPALGCVFWYSGGRNLYLLVYCSLNMTFFLHNPPAQNVVLIFTRMIYYILLLCFEADLHTHKRPRRSWNPWAWGMIFKILNSVHVYSPTCS